MIPAQEREPSSPKTGRIRLSPSASVTPTNAGVILRSDLGTFQVAGPDLAAFLDRMVPLLDGSRDEEAILEALDDYSRESITAFLGLLRVRGLIEPVADDTARRRGPEAFLRTWLQDPAPAMERLAQARVLLAGLEPWGASAALELAAAGLGALHVIDDGAAGPGDTALTRRGAGAALTPWRREALAARIAEEAPWCRVEVSPSDALGDDALIAPGPWALLLAAVRPDDAGLVERTSRLAHRAGIVSLWSHLAGTTAVLGPLVTPGRTACRVCASAEGLNPLASLPAAGSPAPGGALRTAAAAQLLGHMVALEALRQITKYTGSELGGRLLVEDLETLEMSRHTLVRLPWCRVCGDRR